MFFECSRLDIQNKQAKMYWTQPLSKIPHQTWQDHLFSQRNKATKRASSGGRRLEGGRLWTKFEKKGGIGNIGGSSKMVGVRNPLPTVH